MEFDLTKTVALFAVLIAVGIGGLIAAPIPMATTTIMMMVLPSTLVFGGICLFLGVKHGEYRATR
ncbi:DUF7333 family protein [Halorientalis pallida]|uniref:Uncharacterized protein n=1 Tax=Halorientalis pallida TaxID=2479928 RepID=A0A498KWF1_9EURY|nr:hypothetical protein EAF64_20460 [Halorientalis pallida]